MTLIGLAPSPHARLRMAQDPAFLQNVRHQWAACQHDPQADQASVLRHMCVEHPGSQICLQDAGHSLPVQADAMTPATQGLARHSRYAHHSTGNLGLKVGSPSCGLATAEPCLCSCWGMPGGTVAAACLLGLLSRFSGLPALALAAATNCSALITTLRRGLPAKPGLICQLGIEMSVAASTGLQDTSFVHAGSALHSAAGSGDVQKPACLQERVLADISDCLLGSRLGVGLRTGELSCLSSN